MRLFLYFLTGLNNEATPETFVSLVLKKRTL
jgi:hypothetical protein